MSLFLAYVNTRHWIRLFQIQYLRAKDYFGSTYYEALQWTIYNYLQLWTLAYYLEMTLFLGSRFDIYCTLYDDDDIHHWNLYTRLVLYKSWLSRQFSPSKSPSPMSVYTKHNASLQSTYIIMLVLLVTIFFLWHTYVVSCHVLYCSMPLYNLACYWLCIVCYCML